MVAQTGRPHYRYCTLISPSLRILDLLDKRITFQLQYQLIFCLWMLSYNVEVVERMKE